MWKTGKRNVELKIRIHDETTVTHRMNTAREVVKNDAVICDQSDIFFKTERGRLKLRTTSCLSKKSSELIHYERADIAGPKVSAYNRLPLQECEVMVLKSILSRTNGVLGTVEKTRQVFLNEQSDIRIHFDRVHGLGYFMEFEVILLPIQPKEDGEAIANELLRLFKIDSDELITGSYFDEIMKKKQAEVQSSN